MSISVGSLVRTRGREWVVLPESTDSLVHLRPLGGANDEVTAVLRALEEIEPAKFDLPDPKQIGDYRSARLLRDAVRLGFRNSAGPFRSFAKINVDPRPYQLAPLLMALKQDPVRLLIADDVGIGKTIEALLIARELLDRGEITRLAVLCPPQLAEQWQRELDEKFYIEAELVLSSTAARLERNLPPGHSLFDRHDFTVVSTDFIKSERRRDEFLRAAPDFIIVDEAHTVVHAFDRRGGGHQRHELVKDLAEKSERHILLVTATPHSGREEAFRALLALLNKQFTKLPDDLTGPDNEHHRREVARHFVQRRRADIKQYLDAITDFPQREAAEETYSLSEPYRRLFNRVLAYAREIVEQPGEGFRRRVRWWSALALLRSMASSPAAAAATLRSRAATTEADSETDVDEIGRRTVLDLLTDESAEGMDVVPGSDVSAIESLPDDAARHRRRLRAMAKDAEALAGNEDWKLRQLVPILKQLLADGYSPIIFCRFIPTVEYLRDELRAAFPSIEISGVTGKLPPTERERRVAQLMEADKRVLVCTDCLSEGINLQQGFDAVVHYDLSWNPTRHEQRDGRVDRYGQPRERIKVVTYYGIDNQIDGVVLDVLLRKHQSIRNSLGISVPVPGKSEDVVEAIFQGLLMREDADIRQMAMPGFELALQRLAPQWDAAGEREKLSRTMFAQRAINVDEVARELREARGAVGSNEIVQSFMREAIHMHGGTVAENDLVKFDLSDSPRGLRDLLGRTAFVASYGPSAKRGVELLTRTHPIVENVANYVLNTALDSARMANGERHARRAGAIRTRAVARRTTLLLLRLRYHLNTTMRDARRQLLAEDSLSLAFTGSPQNATWLSDEGTEALLDAEPHGQMHLDDAVYFVGKVIEGYEHIAPHLNDVARARGDELRDAHTRVRDAAYRRGEGRPQHHVETLPPDVLGAYVYLPFDES